MRAVLVPSTPAGVQSVLEALRAGELCVIPTDTVYGVAAIVSPGPVRRLYQAKGRPESRPIPVLVADSEAARRLAGEWPPQAEALARAFWPGALTMVVPAAPSLPFEVTAGTGTVGIRWPRGDLVQEIIRGAGGRLAVTSANRSGESPATTADEAAAALGEAVAYVLDGGSLTGNLPSTVVSLTQEDVRVLRRGAIELEAIAAVLATLEGADAASGRTST